MNEKILEIYTSDQGLTASGNPKTSTHFCFEHDFIEGRSAIDQYQIIQSCILGLTDIRENLVEEAQAEYKYFVNQAEKAMKKLWETKPSTPSKKKEYKFLKQQVDKLEHEAARTNHHPNVQNDLFWARESLKKFVSDLRKLGTQI